MSFDGLIIFLAIALVLMVIAMILLGSVFHILFLVELGRFLFWILMGLSLIPLIVVIIYGIYLRVTNRSGRHDP